MREIRTSGSEGGGTLIGSPYPYLLSSSGEEEEGFFAALRMTSRWPHSEWQRWRSA